MCNTKFGYIKSAINDRLDTSSRIQLRISPHKISREVLLGGASVQLGETLNFLQQYFIASSINSKHPRKRIRKLHARQQALRSGARAERGRETSNLVFRERETRKLRRVSAFPKRSANPSPRPFRIAPECPPFLVPSRAPFREQAPRHYCLTRINGRPLPLFYRFRRVTRRGKYAFHDWMLN